jgi:hypothetical protein
VLIATPAIVALVIQFVMPAAQPVRWNLIRSTNSRIRAAIAEGYARSMTFRSLVQDLEASNIILYIDRGECTCNRARACLGFVSSVAGVRYLRSYVSLRQIQRELIQQIAHELFHASEIAGAPEVTSPAEFAGFFESLRVSGCRDPKCYETRGALRSEALVRAELAITTAVGARP